MHKKHIPNTIFDLNLLLMANGFGSDDFPEHEKYTKIYKAYEAYEASLKSKDLSSCDKLDDFRTTIVKLNQARRTYSMDWCLRDWDNYSLRTPHRANIDRIIERLDPVLLRLERECELDMQKILIDKAKFAALPASSNASNSSANSLNVNGNKGPVTVNDHPNINISIPKPPKP
ncbi:MAG: hypothetical protein Q8S21_04415 [Candidatus Paracaedibacteraceae bacterium]|nr:hypothetical protein [Candidatus Paracaedibacteraceae bacterium]